MAKSCPIADFSVNSKIVRFNAFFTFAVTLMFIFTPIKWVIFLLTIDFFLRGFMRGRCSPVAAVSRQVAKLLDENPVLVNAGGPVFAAKIGFVFSLLTSVFFIFSLIMYGYIVVSILAICAALEAFLGYCVGCRLYSLFRVFTKK